MTAPTAGPSIVAAPPSIVQRIILIEMSGSEKMPGSMKPM